MNLNYTYCFLNIPNKSNFASIYYIPMMVSLITKYIAGDLDIGYNYTVKDIYFWIYNLVLSYLLIRVFLKF